MMSWMPWLTAAISIIGTVLVIRKRLSGFYLWCVSNIVWVWIDINAEQYAQAVLFTVYLGLSVFGAWEWKSLKK